jgi:hypothetical protein
MSSRTLEFGSGVIRFLAALALAGGMFVFPKIAAPLGAAASGSFGAARPRENRGSAAARVAVRSRPRLAGAGGSGGRKWATSKERPTRRVLTLLALGRLLREAAEADEA